jgi:putative DNA primase/helicase
VIDDAIELVQFGLALVPVHYPIKVGSKVVCSCNRGERCTSIAKHPFSNKWQEVGEKNPEHVRAWSKAFKAEVNYGVITGQLSGVVVLDIDPRHGGQDSLDNLMVKHGKLPDTAQVITGSGGSHYYFKSSGYLKNGTNIGGNSGVDFRGDGGFVVAPGSRHASGGTYEWEASSHPSESGFAPLPDWLHKLIYQPIVKRTELSDENNVSKVIQEGGRNVWLASIGGVLRNKGLGYKPIMAALWYSNLDHCSPPLSQDEVRLIAKSISKYTNNQMGNIL